MSRLQQRDFKPGKDPMVDVMFRLLNLLYCWLYTALNSRMGSRPSFMGSERKEDDEFNRDEEEECTCIRLPSSGSTPGLHRQWKDACSSFSLKAFLYFGGFEVS